MQSLDGVQQFFLEGSGPDSDGLRETVAALFELANARLGMFIVSGGTDAQLNAITGHVSHCRVGLQVVVAGHLRRSFE